ncbi:MAG: hypothetical protein NXI23_23135 [Bacteroidetes bacterium]|jgi:hypothetical protein|nr:hypothetical protein [Bacteroidota bacterium]MDF1867745.1 hypothetical protein [Saprospiraceae bacterium]
MNFKFLSFIFFALLAFSSCDSGNEDLVDCPELGLNFGDECELTFPDRPDTYTGAVSEDCECLLEGTDNVDCPELRLNIGDECGRDADDNPVYVDENCECIGAVGADYDCPDLEANIGEECRDSDGNIGTIDSDCECDLD